MGSAFWGARAAGGVASPSPDYSCQGSLARSGLALSGAALANQRLGTPEAASKAVEHFKAFIGLPDAEPEKRGKAASGLSDLIAGVAGAAVVGGTALLLASSSSVSDGDAAMNRFEASGRTNAGGLDPFRRARPGRRRRRLHRLPLLDTSCRRRPRLDGRPHRPVSTPRTPRRRPVQNRQGPASRPHRRAVFEQHRLSSTNRGAAQADRPVIIGWEAVDKPTSAG